MISKQVKAVPTKANQEQMTPVIVAAWEKVFGSRPSLSQVAKAWAQIAIETGHGTYILNNNVGNINWTEGCGFDYYMTHDDRSVNGNPAVREKYSQKRRAYPTLVDGVADYLNLLKHRPGVLKNLMSKGSPNEFSHALADVKYYDPFVRDDYVDKNGHKVKGYTSNLTSNYNDFIANYRKNKGTMPASSNGNRKQDSVATSEPETGGIVDWFLHRLDGFVSKFASEETTTHLLNIESSLNFASKLEYARILKSALETELDVKSSIYTNDKIVEMEIYSPFNDYNSSIAITEVSNAIANAFEKATQDYITVNIDTNLQLNKESSLQELNIKTAEKAYRNFSLQIISRK